MTQQAVALERVMGFHLIGERRIRDGVEAFDSLSPANRQQALGSFPKGTAAEADAAVAAARAAYPSWRRTSRIYRADLFDKLSQLIKRDVDALSQLMAVECGKVLNECRAEVIEGLHMVQYVFGTGRMPIGHIVASEIAEKDAFVRRKPWGVAAIITPWNFPFAVPLWMLGPTLLEGNTVVFKPSEDTPAVGQRLIELFLEAGFPPGVVNLVHGDHVAGEALVKNAGVNIVLFTGSWETGSRIQKLSADFYDRIVACEMGSKSAVIIFDDCKFDLAVNAGILSAFKTSGQRCVSSGRLLVQRSLVDRYADAFVAAARRLHIGDPLDPQSFTGPVIHEGAVEKVLFYNDLAKKEHAQVLFDGGRLTEGPRAQGCYLAPFIYRQEHKPGVRTLREEVFGPHVAIVPFNDLDDAIRIYNDTEYGLSLAVITEDYRKMRHIREECEFGMGYVNLPSIGAEVHLPFGGVKKSGNGHPSAAGLVDVVTHKVSWTVNHGEEIKMAQGLKAEVSQ